MSEALRPIAASNTSRCSAVGSFILEAQEPAPYVVLGHGSRIAQERENLGVDSTMDGRDVLQPTPFPEGVDVSYLCANCSARNAGCAMSRAMDRIYRQPRRVRAGHGGGENPRHEQTDLS